MANPYLGLGGLILLASAAPAQDLLLDLPHLPGDADRNPDGWWSYVRADGASFRNAPIDGRAGSIGVDRYELGLELEHHGDAGILGLSLDHSRQSYNPGWQLGGLTSPLEIADHFRLQAAWHDRAEDRMTWYVGARAESGAEHRKGSLGDAALGATFGLELGLTEGLGLELSLDALDQLEDGSRLVPLALVDWRLADDLRLGRVAGGYGLDWGYDPETRYFLALDQDERQFRLDQESGGGGIVRDRETTLRAGMLWQPRADLRLELCLGQADRHMTLLDGDQRIDGFGVDDATFLGVRLDFGPGALF